MHKFVVFHPSKNLILTVDTLIKERAPGLLYTNVVKENLLDEVIKGGITDHVIKEIENVVSSIPSGDDYVMLCTCSTLGGKTEEIGRMQGKTVLRIDRPMAERAVEIGGKIGIAAALESTMEPTINLIKEVAKEKGKTVETTPLLIPGAWDKKKSGDERGYINVIQQYLNEQSAKYDVIVLAQGSMAPATVGLTFDSPSVLTSTMLGVEYALDLYASREKSN